MSSHITCYSCVPNTNSGRTISFNNTHPSNMLLIWYSAFIFEISLRYDFFLFRNLTTSENPPSHIYLNHLRLFYKQKKSHHHNYSRGYLYLLKMSIRKSFLKEKNLSIFFLHISYSDS